MRLSSVVVAVVLLSSVVFSPVVFAQHSSGGGGGSSGGGSHGSSGGGSSGSSSHSSSSGGSAGGGSNHSASGHSSSGSGGSSRAHTSARNSGASSHNSSVAAAGSRANASSHSAAAKTTQPGKRRFFSFLRHPFRRSEPKPTESDLRVPVCKGENCKKPAPKPPEPAPALVESDLRRPACKGKVCGCPPGEVQGKNGGCVAAPTNNSGGCAAGQSRNGGACSASAHQCSPDTYWNGASCVARQECATINSRAASLANEVRAARAQMQSACSNNSSAPECSGVKQNFDGAVERYRTLMNGTPANCRSLVPDPLSL
jgi:hypothetical protein